MIDKKAINIYSSQMAFEHLAAALAGYSQPLKSIAIIGTSEGVGATTVATNLARTLSAANQNVLLVSIQKDGAAQGSANHITGASTLLASTQKSSEGFFHAAIPAVQFPQVVPGNDAVFGRLNADLLERHTIVIWDLLPIDSLPLSGAIAKYAQGVVLVIHAGKTRWHSARHALNTLRFSGANVLGVVLNKKRMYIPSWLYRFLFRYAA